MIPIAELEQWKATRTLRSPNQNARPAGQGIRCIVLHSTAGTDAGAESWMANADADVSAHIHIRRDGTTTRMVNDSQRAWHAGASRWGGMPDVNDFSLGWEIGNDNRGEPYTDAQYATLIKMGVHYVKQGIPLHAFVSHEEIAVPKGRKTDPYQFDWVRFIVGIRTALNPPKPPHVVPPPPRPIPEPKLELQAPKVREPFPVIPAPGQPTGWRRFVPSFPRRVAMSQIVQAKPWWASKTLWFNLLTALATLLGLAQSMVAELPFTMPGGVTATLVVLITAVNFGLRLVTDKPVASSAKPVTT